MTTTGHSIKYWGSSFWRNNEIAYQSSLKCHSGYYLSSTCVISVVFTCGQFWPFFSSIVATCVCVIIHQSMYLCVNHLHVCMKTQDPFKLGYQIWTKGARHLGLGDCCFFVLFCFCFLGGFFRWGGTLNFQVKLNLKVKIDPILCLSSP